MLKQPCRVVVGYRWWNRLWNSRWYKCSGTDDLLDGLVGGIVEGSRGGGREAGICGTEGTGNLTSRGGGAAVLAAREGGGGFLASRAGGVVGRTAGFISESRCQEVVIFIFDRVAFLRVSYGS